jgi:hypothetical protein
MPKKKVKETKPETKPAGKKKKEFPERGFSNAEQGSPQVARQT